MLIVFAGLPGTGKSTIAKALAGELGAVYLRLDSLEQALVNSGLVKDQWDIGPSGYAAAQALAADNLALGQIVVADCVNPLEITRDAWRKVAHDAGEMCLEIELVCTDKQEHHRRVAGREPSIEGLALPNWSAVEKREYEPWNRDHVILDTARVTPERAVAAIIYAVGQLVSRE